MVLERDGIVGLSCLCIGFSGLKVPLDVNPRLELSRWPQRPFPLHPSCCSRSLWGSFPVLGCISGFANDWVDRREDRVDQGGRARVSCVSWGSPFCRIRWPGVRSSFRAVEFVLSQWKRRKRFGGRLHPPRPFRGLRFGSAGVYIRAPFVSG